MSPRVAGTALDRVAPRVAFLAPGQGAKRVDVTLRSFARAPRGRALFELAARAAGVPFERVLARPSLLDRTDVLQPMLTALSLFAGESLLAAGIPPALVAGHSLGELAAWSLAGGPTAEDAIELAALRGRLMAREAARFPGGMVALTTNEQAVFEKALEAGRRAGALGLAARNAPDETVLSGDEAAIRAVLTFAPSEATRLPTSGAWHSESMAGALKEWNAAVHAVAEADKHVVTGADKHVATGADKHVATGADKHVAGRSGACLFVANRTGEVVRDRAEIPALLAEQLVRPVEWARSLAAVSAGADVIVTLGPGAVLRALVRRNVPAESMLLATDDERALAETTGTLRSLLGLGPTVERATFPAGRPPPLHDAKDPP